MKPGFALKLSSEGIVLLHRAIRGWLVVGEAAPDDPKLGQALAYLRRTARDLDPHGLTTKLILPQDQILYANITAPGRSEAQRRAQVAAALEGRTPYALDEIVFDIAGDGPELQVAAVARETLQEAEAFATQHGFNPVSFVALPDPGSFDGEPFFGQTEASAKILGKAAKVARDDAAVTIVGRAVLPRTENTAADAGKADAPPPKPAAKPAPQDLVAPATAPPEDQDMGMLKAAAKDGARNEVAHKVAHEAADATPGTEAEAPRLPLHNALTPTPDHEADAPGGEPASGDPAQADPAEADTLAGALAANMAKSLTEVSGGRVTFASRRQSLREAAAAPETAAPDTPSPDTPSPDTSAPDAASADASGRGKPPTRRRPPQPLTPPAQRRPVARPASPLPDRDAVASAAAPSASAPAAESAAESGAESGTESGAEPWPAPLLAGPAGGAGAAEENPFLSMMSRPQPRRNPRLVLIVLAAATLGLVALLGLWSVLVFSNRETGPATTRTAAQQPLRAPLPGTATPRITEPSPLPDLSLPAPVLPNLGPLAAPGESPATALPSPEARAAETPRPAPPQAATRDAGPGALPAGATPAMPSDPVTRLVPATIRTQKAPAPSRPPAPSALGTILRPVPAPAPQAVGAAAPRIAPAAPESRDAALRAPINPPAYGTKFDLGPDGLVVPTAKGARTPDGAMVYAGRPPVVPPPRPGSPAAAAPAQGQPEQAQTTPQPAAPQPVPAPEKFPGASRLAVASSLVPPQRPADFSKIVAAALAAAQASRAASTASVATAPTDSGAVESQDAEPEPTAVAPRIPTSASVAKRATVKNAISLNRLSLIGVFGAESRRQALVRTSRGKIVKVKVGDRLDSGQVSAIGEHELYYVKNGRNIRLTMPKG